MDPWYSLDIIGVSGASDPGSNPGGSAHSIENSLYTAVYRQYTGIIILHIISGYFD